MNTTKIRIRVDQREAIRVGKNSYGMIVIDIDPGELDADQRMAMSNCYIEYNREDGLSLPYPQKDFQNLPPVGEANVDTAKTLLTAWVQAQQIAKMKKQNEIDTEVAHGIALPIDDLMFLHGDKYDYSGRWELHEYTIRNVISDPRLAPKLAEVRTEIDKRNALLVIQKNEYKTKKAETERTKEEKRMIEEKIENEKIAHQKQQIADWVSVHGTDNQKKRTALNLLPENEILDAMRDEVFAPLADLPRYEKLTKSDIPCECEYDQPEYHYNSNNETEATAEQFEIMEKIMTLMPGAVVTLRWHRGYCEACSDSENEDDGVVERHSIRVAMTIGDYSFSREYAA